MGHRTNIYTDGWKYGIGYESVIWVKATEVSHHTYKRNGKLKIGNRKLRELRVYIVKPNNNFFTKKKGKKIEKKSL